MKKRLPSVTPFSTNYPLKWKITIILERELAVTGVAGELLAPYVGTGENG
jgi:hypothetical protein